MVDAASASARGVVVARRRSGGGAVYLAPGEQIWADLWIPRDDPLWSADVSRSAAVAGEWWYRALGSAATRVSIHRGTMQRALGAEQVCFAWKGPGEVMAGAKKLVGLAQWRSREGVLVQGCCYVRWDPAAMADLLAVTAEERVGLLHALEEAATDLEAVGASWLTIKDLVAALPSGPAFETVLV